MSCWLPWWLSGKAFACQCRICGFNPRVWKIPWRRKWQSTPVFLPGKSHGQRIWQATVQGVIKSRTWLNDWTTTTTRQERQRSQFSLSFWAQDRLCLGCEFYLKALRQGYQAPCQLVVIKEYILFYLLFFETLLGSGWIGRTELGTLGSSDLFPPQPLYWGMTNIVDI